MRRAVRAVAGAAILAALCAVPVVAAFAQLAPVGQGAIAPAQAGGGIIDIGQAFSQALAPYVNALVQAGIAALISWAVWKLKQKTGIAIDAGHRDALTRALENQAGSLIADGLVKISDGKVTVADTPLDEAAADAIHSIPDAANHLGLTPAYVAKRIIDTIPQTAAGAQMIAAAAKA